MNKPRKPRQKTKIPSDGLLMTGKIYPRPRREWGLDSMQVGQSFEFDGDKIDYNRLWSARSAYSKRTGKKFEIRTIKPGRYRCRRIR